MEDLCCDSSRISSRFVQVAVVTALVHASSGSGTAMINCILGPTRPLKACTAAKGIPRPHCTTAGASGGAACSSCRAGRLGVNSEVTTLCCQEHQATAVGQQASIAYLSLHVTASALSAAQDAYEGPRSESRDSECRGSMLLHIVA